jgi:hypothetical protein
MEEKKMSWLSNELVDKGFSLYQYGISNLGFRYPTIIDVINEAMQKGKVILGGDIFFLANNKLDSKGDNWYYNKVGVNDSRESCSKAFKYLNNYPLENSDCIITLVVVD